jgi:hypothetical protein
VAGLGCYVLLNRIFSSLYISAEVHREIVSDAANDERYGELAGGKA